LRQEDLAKSTNDVREFVRATLPKDGQPAKH
jgi:hypothetical protein